MRGIMLLLAVAVVAACDDDDGKTGPPKKVNAEKPDKEPVSPPTGISQIQGNTEDIAKDLAELEKAETPDPTTLAQLRKRIDVMLVVTEKAIAGEAEEAVRKKHGLLMQQQARLYQERADVTAEIGEIEKMLEEFDRTGKVPPGFTEAELRDRLKDETEKATKLAEEWEALRVPLKECEDLLDAGGTIPPQEATLLTREREALLALKERAEALR